MVEFAELGRAYDCSRTFRELVNLGKAYIWPEIIQE